MYNSAVLLDIHERAHRSLKNLIAHCAQLPEEEILRTMPGFGQPTLQLQLHHTIQAEEYWISVVNGGFDVEDNEATCLSCGSCASENVSRENLTRLPDAKSRRSLASRSVARISRL